MPAMRTSWNLDYALARVHARHGERLDEFTWRRLEASRDAGQYLDALRTTPLRAWVVSIDGSMGTHAIERTLRTEWINYVDHVANWHPLVWQPWIAWCAWLPVLSLLAQLSRPEPAPPWMLADPICRPVAPGSPIERATALRNTPLAPLETAVLGRVHVAAVWRAHWLAIAPRMDTHTRHLLNLLLTAVDTHTDRLLGNCGNAATLRQQHCDRLARLFRLGAETAVATLCHLGLLALDLQRLRGELLTRVALPAPVGEAA
jgi:hypothetical protein